ncbi:MAG: histidinol dehydrogenase [Peptococcaceae bacterium]|jgi:histidinol dehydrogenase/sulfopropanediol 3-dehydrogenase|nr:histidinol dehydrogenase [Peptococcaceae bacterium]MDH7526206.1 histidinol dehydrogenase [Peptococcaceae bacterium]
MIFLKEAKNSEPADRKKVSEQVAALLDMVKQGGDRAIIELTRKFDGVDVDRIRVDRSELDKAYESIDTQTVESLKFAAEQIRFFSSRQLECLKPLECQNLPGVTLGHRLIPIESCGAYVPGGRYPLPSSALMSVIPAKVAGVKRIAACSPPSREFGGIHPAVLVALDIAGADEIYCLGGVQAVAAFAYGTESVKRVDVIVGPGNRYVTEAKRQVSGEVGIDMLAGPSEVLIIADDTADPRFIALDLLAQSEHDPSARGILVTTSRLLAEEVQIIIRRELEKLPTAETASKSWEDNGLIILAASLEEAVEISDAFAPEHLEIHTIRDEELALRVRNFGALFIGQYASESFGDYVAGSNHILPTMGCARFSNGVWPGTFLKVASYQQVTREGAALLYQHSARLAGVEGLAAHRRAALLRGE